MTLKDKPSDIFGIILLTPEELETGAGACTETVEIGYFMRFFNFCAFCIYIRGGVGIISGDCRLFSEIRRPQLLSLINTITYIFVFMHEKHYVCIA